MIQVVNREPAAGQAGRVKLTLDDGTVLEGVLSMDDGASPEGTPWNAQTGRLLQADIRTYPAATAITAGDVVDISNGQATTDGTPGQGIALQTVQAGADVDVIFSGITFADWVQNNQSIYSPAVKGYGIQPGVLYVYPFASIGEIITGTYTGNGASSRTISIGLTPKLLAVIPTGGYNYSDGVRDFFMLLIAQGVTYYAESHAGDIALKIVDNGFQIGEHFFYIGANKNIAGPNTNSDGELYYYIAIA